MKKIAIILFLPLLLSGCIFSSKKNQSVNTNTPLNQNTLQQQLISQSKIKKFNNPEEFKQYLTDNPISNNYLRSDMMRGEVAMLAQDAAGSQSTNSLKAPEASVDFSKTNIQVAGVDEPDIIKSDGKYLYALVYNILYIIDAVPAEQTKIVSRIKFTSRPQDLFISDNRLIVFGLDEQMPQREIYKTFIRRNSYTFF